MKKWKGENGQRREEEGGRREEEEYILNQIIFVTGYLSADTHLFQSNNSTCAVAKCTTRIR